MAEPVYKCKDCPKRFTINNNGDCSEICPPRPVAIEARQSIVGNIVRKALGVVTVLILGMGLQQELSQPVTATPVVQTVKPVHHVRKHHHKKCHCSCKKSLTKPVQHYNTNDKPDVEELESRITTLEERLNNGK